MANHPLLEGWGDKAMPEEMFSRCGCSEMLGDGTPSLKLPTNRPLILVRDPLPNWTVDQIWGWLEKAHARWGEVCNWAAKRIHDIAEAGPGDVVNLVTVADLGGSGVLADQMLPYPGARVLAMRINSRVTWKPTDGQMVGGIDPIRTLCHEIGHFQGHQHWPVGPPLELMEPFVSQTIISPQPTEAKVSASWFGDPQTPPAPPVPPAPPAGRRAVTYVFLDQAGAEVFRAPIP
jgi:hypothetical protein